MAEPHTQPRPHRRRVPRWVWFVAACVALGAMTSVGVAWVGVCRELTPKPFWKSQLGDVRLESAVASVRINGIRSTNTLATSFEISTATMTPAEYAFSDEFIWQYDGKIELVKGFLESTPFLRALRRHEPILLSPYWSDVTFTVTTAGWPMHCVSCEDAASPNELWGPNQIRVRVYDQRTGELVDPPVVTNPKAQLSRNYGAIQVGDTLLPFHPMWPGLIANTAIYGGAWAVLIGATVLPTRWFVRRRRARRGGCPQCGYSREGLKVDAPCPECGRAKPAAHDATPNPTAR